MNEEGRRRIKKLLSSGELTFEKVDAAIDLALDSYHEQQAARTRERIKLIAALAAIAGFAYTVVGC